MATKTHSKKAQEVKYHTILRMPPLRPDQHLGLKASIAVHGVKVPILVDSDGPERGIIDGTERKQISVELGYPCPEIVESGLDEEEERILARSLNLARREMSSEQKRQLIADQLKETPERSLRWIAKMLGVSPTTVGSVRDELVSTVHLGQLTKTVGLDGKSRHAYWSHVKPTSLLPPSASPDQCYQTPAVGVQPLIKHLRKNWVVWEPSAGLGSIVTALGNAGHKVIASDIKQGKDFFAWKPRSHFDCIVTNPPHKFMTEWIARCYAIGKPFALLVPHRVLEGQERHAMFRKHGVQLIFLDRRIAYSLESGECETEAPFGSLWCCWKMLKKDLVFEVLE